MLPRLESYTKSMDLFRQAFCGDTPISVSSEFLPGCCLVIRFSFDFNYQLRSEFFFSLSSNTRIVIIQYDAPSR